MPELSESDQTLPMSTKDDFAVSAPVVPQTVAQSATSQQYKSGSRGVLLAIFAIFLLGVTAASASMGYLGQDAQKFLSMPKLFSDEWAGSASVSPTPSPSPTAEAKVEIKTRVASNCGLSIPLPQTTSQKDGKELAWRFEERSLSATTSFYAIDTDVFPRSYVLGSFVKYKAEADFLKPDKNGQFNLATVGLDVLCIDNTTNLSLEEYVGMVQANKTYKVQVYPSQNWGEVEVIPVHLEGRDLKKSGQDNGFLAVTADKKRLLYLRNWTPDEGELIGDMNLMRTNLKYRDSPTPLSAIQVNTQVNVSSTASTAKTVASCLRLNIREGEFAGNKCYAKKDYDDLQYYLQRYDSTGFTLNGLASQMDIVCSGSEFFKNDCESAKQQKSQAESDREKYKGIIQGIIARGK